MVVPRGAPGSVVMRVAPLAVTNAALTLCAILTWVYGTANAQDKGTFNPEPLPPSVGSGCQSRVTEPRNSLSAEVFAVGSAGTASTKPSRRRGIVGSAGSQERGKGTGWIAWKPGRSRSRPRASKPIPGPDRGKRGAVRREPLTGNTGENFE